MKFSYFDKINKNTILNLLFCILILIMLSQIYYLFNPSIIEGNALKREYERAKKKAEEEARKQAEAAKRLAEQQLQEFENIINKLIKPIKELKNVTINTLNSLINL